jgi:molybdenum cofactor synthesis domain-containing protein
VTFRVGIVTISDTAARGEREDVSGATIREMVGGVGAEVLAYVVAPDEVARIEAVIRDFADVRDLDVILTTGGTGLSPRDVTPEAMARVLDYEAPGIAEAMRAEGLKHTRRAMLSRAKAGVRGRTLVVNLPGSPKGVRESLGAVLDVLGHAVEILRSSPTDH